MRLEQRPRALRGRLGQPGDGDEPSASIEVVSRMSREAHVRFDGSGEGQFLPATLQRCGKGPPGAGQVSDEKTNVSEPLPEASIDGSTCQNRGVS
jgi:hypothetical protein